MIARLSALPGRAIDPDAAARALTLAELAALVEGARDEGGSGSFPSWREVLEAPEPLEEARRVLGPPGGLGDAVVRLTRLLARMATRLYCRLRVVGAEHLPRQRRPFIIAPNHVSFADPAFIYAALPWEVSRDACYLGWSGYFHRGFGGWAARRLRIIPVDVGGNLLRALQLGRACLTLDRALVVFPEGERTLDGRLGEFKKGTALLVRHSGAPVVPAALVGAHRVWPRGKSFPRPARVTLAFGRPIDFRERFTQDEEADVEEINRELRESIASLLEEHGGLPPRGEEGGATFDSPRGGC
jgi:long-chain acyl-CoA synthetase